MHYGDDRDLRLEFFVTEPLETLIKKRAAFIVARQQHRDPTKWYDGLYSLWDRRQPEGRNLLGPDHLAGNPPYAVSGSDDPSNGKCLLVAEMPIDSTAYESTYAAAKYALQYGLQPDDGLWHDRNLNRTYSHPHIDSARHREFLERQHTANLACRGALEAHYWALGSDFRGCGAASYTLSYMSQMGGWAVLDYALQFAADPSHDLRLGYASLLSSWALLNSGDAESKYGYWTPGALHDGAMSWGFQPRQVGSEWFPTAQQLPRGAWPLCGEADHGLVAGIEAARTVLVDDPDFGVIAYGGSAKRAEGVYSVVPRDGVRQRLSVLLGELRVHLELERDGIAAERPIEIEPRCASIAFQLESRAPEPHATRLTLAGLPAGDYVAEHAGVARPFRADEQAIVRLQLAVDRGGPVAIRRTAPPAPSGIGGGALRTSR